MNMTANERMNLAAEIGELSEALKQWQSRLQRLEDIGRRTDAVADARQHVRTLDAEIAKRQRMLDAAIREAAAA